MESVKLHTFLCSFNNSEPYTVEIFCLKKEKNKELLSKSPLLTFSKRIKMPYFLKLTENGTMHFEI
jgi:hypothetical protein